MQSVVAAVLSISCCMHMAAAESCRAAHALAGVQESGTEIPLNPGRSYFYPPAMAELTQDRQWISAAAAEGSSA